MKVAVCKGPVLVCA